MKRFITFTYLGACFATLLYSTPARATTSEPNRQPVCAWRQYVELHRTPGERRYGFKEVTTDQRRAFQLICTIARLAIARRRLSYQFRIDCHRFDDDTWICLGTLHPSQSGATNGVSLVTRRVYATPYPASFGKNIAGLLGFIQEWSS